MKLRADQEQRHRAGRHDEAERPVEVQQQRHDRDERGDVDRPGRSARRTGTAGSSTGRSSPGRAADRTASSSWNATGSRCRCGVEIVAQRASPCRAREQDCAHRRIEDQHRLDQPEAPSARPPSSHSAGRSRFGHGPVDDTLGEQGDGDRPRRSRRCRPAIAGRIDRSRAAGRPGNARGCASGGVESPGTPVDRSRRGLGASAGLARPGERRPMSGVAPEPDGRVRAPGCPMPFGVGGQGCGASGRPSALAPRRTPRSVEEDVRVVQRRQRDVLHVHGPIPGSSQQWPGSARGRCPV